MATVSDGQNPGRSATPQRQSPAPKRQGRSEGGLDPTVQLGQTPSEIFGFAQSYNTGAPGSQGATSADADVTTQAGQLEGHTPGIQVAPGEVTSTGLSGSQGGSKPGGGESVRYTDPFGYQGNAHREVTASNPIGGDSDSTKAIDGYSPGPTLPVLENNRPASTGIGQGSVRGAGHPNAGR